MRCTVVDDTSSDSTAQSTTNEDCDKNNQQEDFPICQSSILASMLEENTSKCGALTQRLRREEFMRTLDEDFAQCTCKLRLNYLRPIGQQLQYLTGYALSNLRSSSTSSPARVARTVLFPIHLFHKDTIQKYQKKTNVLCWWCRHKFPGMPVGCPIKLREVWNSQNGKGGKHREFTLHGYFCSYPCALAYGQHMPHKSPRLQLELRSYFRILIQEIHAGLKKNGDIDDDKTYPIPELRPAPHFCVLKIFGGDKTIEEFRSMPEWDNGHQLDIVPDWVNVIPSGMAAHEYPIPHQQFATEYNIHVLREHTQQRRERWLRQNTKKQQRKRQKNQRTATDEVKENQAQPTRTNKTTNPARTAAGNQRQRAFSRVSHCGKRGRSRDFNPSHKKPNRKRFRLMSKHPTKNQIQMCISPQHFQ